jgi:hypothetical protein
MGSNQYVSILPFAWDYYYNAASPVTCIINSDIYGTLASIFALSRGGVRMKFVETTNVGSSTFSISGFTTGILGQFTASIGAMLFTNTTGNYVGNKFLQEPTGTKAVFQSPVGIHPEIAIPQYHRYHSRANLDHMCNTTYTYDTGTGTTSSRTFIEYWNHADNLAAIPMRACADDANFGMFVSIPPMTTQSGGNAST